MAKTIEVVYEGGVLRPLSPLRLEEHEKLSMGFGCRVYTFHKGKSASVARIREQATL
jgi:predicted DNA-binding antitoxin AbrB/MazE fold protein